MSITVKVTSQINIPGVMKKINDNTFWTFAANEWHRMISPFTPFRTGNLDQNVDIQPKEIHYNMYYAAEVYHKNAKFRKDIHPLASREWDAAAVAAGAGDDLIASMQGYINSGRLNING
jgi:hypothetical protein